jgi:peptide/nickel transport system ATP-binding protein
MTSSSEHLKTWQDRAHGRAERTAGGTENPPLLRLANLTIGFVPRGRREPVHVVSDISFTVGRREIVGLVGESGSGKTQTARAILRLNSPPLRPLSGSIFLDGADLLAMSDRDIRQVRGGRVAMIFQHPRSALNPLMRIGDQLARVYALHQGVSYRTASAQALAMVRRVGIAGPKHVVRSYPHQLSGGMCQRVMIGMALGIRPELLIADEPTTGLDVTIQAQILELIKEMHAETGASVLLITHDLGVVAETCQRVIVMYQGRVVEIAGVKDLFFHPMHPYTIRLIGSTMNPDRRPEAPTPGVKAASTIELSVGPELYRASLDDAPSTDPSVTLKEVAPGHLVLCRRLTGGLEPASGALSALHPGAKAAS